jgi:hypothetical protein
MKILTVYNTAGISGKENIDWYIQCIKSIYNQKNVEQKIIVSSCLNNDNTIKSLKHNFSDLEIVRFNHKFTVNMTFNKATKVMIDKYGKFDAYMYIDSGVLITDENALSNAISVMENNKCAMTALQTDTDTGYQYFGPQFKLDSSTPQIINNDFIIPFGTGVNLHAQLFSHEIYDTYNNIIPDVFVAYCTESTFPFICASINKKWMIVKDTILIHKRSVDGASSGQVHVSKKYMNPWNNLFANRNAEQFIFDEEAVQSGLGYEECNKIMLHKKEAYHEDYKPKNPELLSKKIKQYFYLNEKELNYIDMPYELF